MTQHHAVTSLTLSYPVTPEAISTALDVYRGHSFETPVLYKAGSKAIAHCRDLRVSIEERRKLLKADSLAYGREVDRIAKQLTELVEAVEKPLKAAKQEVDDAKERAKREAALAEQRRIEAEAREKLEAEAEQHRAQRAAEEKRLFAERAELEQERARMAAERAELEQLRKDAAARREALEAQESAAKAERAAQERAERLKAEAEEARLNQLEHDRQRAKRLAALQPDQDKLNQLARAIRDVQGVGEDWEFESDAAVDAWEVAMSELGVTAKKLEHWKEQQR
jgi:fused signal recognition particle receptor